MKIYEFFLQGSICSFNETIYPWTSWINEVVPETSPGQAFDIGEDYPCINKLRLSSSSASSKEITMDISNQRNTSPEKRQ